jgi:hypothetical protein
MATTMVRDDRLIHRGRRSRMASYTLVSSLAAMSSRVITSLENPPSEDPPKAHALRHMVRPTTMLGQYMCSPWLRDSVASRFSS